MCCAFALCVGCGQSSTPNVGHVIPYAQPSTPYPTLEAVIHNSYYQHVYEYTPAYEGSRVDITGKVLDDVTQNRKGTVFQMLVFPNKPRMKTAVIMNGIHDRNIKPGYMVPGYMVRVRGTIEEGITATDKTGKKFQDVFIRAKSVKVVSRNNLSRSMSYLVVYARASPAHTQRLLRHLHGETG